MDKGINFRVDEELYRAVKVRIAMSGKSLKEYFVELIKKDLEEAEKK